MHGLGVFLSTNYLYRNVTDMNRKKVVRINESQLRRIVNESVKRILNEMTSENSNGFCPECGFEFTTGDGNSDYDYDFGTTHCVCPDCGWEGEYDELSDCC